MLKKQNKSESCSYNFPNNITTFFSPSVPDEIKCAIPLMHELNVESGGLIIGRCFADPAQNPGSQDFLQFSKALGISADQCGIINTAVEQILRTIVKNKILNTVVATDLRKMNLPEFIVDGLLSHLKDHRITFERSLIPNKIRFPSILKFKWRIDITISTGFVSRVMRPTILFQVSC